MEDTTQRQRQSLPQCIRFEWRRATESLTAHGVAFKTGSLHGMCRSIESSTDVKGRAPTQSAMLCSLHRICWSMESATTLKGSTGSSISLLLPLGFVSRWEWRLSGHVSDALASVAQTSVGRLLEGSEEFSFEPIRALLRCKCLAALQKGACDASWQAAHGHFRRSWPLGMTPIQVLHVKLGAESGVAARATVASKVLHTAASASRRSSLLFSRGLRALPQRAESLARCCQARGASAGSGNQGGVVRCPGVSPRPAAVFPGCADAQGQGLGRSGVAVVLHTVRCAPAVTPNPTHHHTPQHTSPHLTSLPLHQCAVPKWKNQTLVFFHETTAATLQHCNTQKQ